MSRRVAVIGAGPAGLIAADMLSHQGLAVTVYDRMPSPGRKFLMAGRGGLNLTHSEPLDRFLTRYTGSIAVGDSIAAFTPDDLRALAAELGEETFVGTSGRVFPRSFKASPLLRAWLARLRDRGAALLTRQTLVGFEGSRPTLADADGITRTLDCDATVLALGGASWPRLGSDGTWADLLRARDVAVLPLRAANCGVQIPWSTTTQDKFAGAPLKRVAFSFGAQRVRGEAVITHDGLEGGAIYALASAIRSTLEDGGPAELFIDFAPDLSPDEIAAKLSQGRTSDSRANALRKRLSMSPAALAVMRESLGGPLPSDPAGLARRVKAIRLPVVGTAGLNRAISTAGGVSADAIDAALMLHALPGVFVAGEMLDWDAPTGGYLIQASLATGAAAARGVLGWLRET